ncbi:MAG: glycosyltransferase, partial [Chitinophagaceae bacterium]|nr:glycosyltransferase [Chitinophagaceae bacterium]
MKLRVAFVSFEYPPDSGWGGIATYVAQAAALLKTRGHEVEVFASSPTRNNTTEEQGILIHWIKENNRDDFPVIAGHRMAERHALAPFDVLESPEYYADGRKAVELIPELPLVVRLHTPSRLIIDMTWPHPWYYPLTRLKELVHSFLLICFNKSGKMPVVNPKQYWNTIDLTEKKFTRRANRVVALCADLKEFARQTWKIDEQRVVVSPNVYHPKENLLALQPNPSGCTFG